MMKKLVASPVKAERALAMRRMMTRGLRNLARNCRIKALFRSPWIRLGPKRARRRAASALLSPSGPDFRRSMSAETEICQNGGSVLTEGVGMKGSSKELPLQL